MIDPRDTPAPMKGYHPVVLAALTEAELRTAVNDALEAGNRAANTATELMRRGVDHADVTRVRETARRWFASHAAALTMLRAREVEAADVHL